MYFLADVALPITDPVFIFALVMMIILIAPLLFSRFKIPGIIGLIIAGVIVGPNATGLLERDQTMELLGTVGLLYIMFVAGLEINLAQFEKYRNRSLFFGSLTFLLPQVSGTLLAVYLLGFAWTPAILLASMFASHTLLAYPTASRLGISKTEPVTTTVGGTIITDTAALLVLVVIAGSVEGTLNAAFWLRLVSAMAIYGVLVFWGLPRLGRWFFRRLRAESTAEFVFVLAAVFLSALLSEFAGMEPIIGAFMAGLALNRLIPEQSILMDRIHFVGNSLFIPFFLISVGMLVDVELFTAESAGWVVAGFMVVTVVATKFLAADITRRYYRYSKEEGMVVFGLSVAQAAATLAVVIVGYELGVFGDAVLNGTILMILVTCLLSPWIVERYGRRMAQTEERKPYRASEAPQRILVPLANPTTAASLMDVALLTRYPGQDEPIYPLVVVREGADVEAEVAASEKLLGHAVAHGTAAGVPIHPVTRIDVNATDGIKRAIRERRISEVVIGWAGNVSTSERIFGTVLDQLLTDTRAQVLVCKLEHPVNTVDRILMAIPPFADREPGFTSAMHAMKAFANQLGANLTVIATPASIASFRSSIMSLKPDVKVQFLPIEAWAGLLAALDDIAKPHDLRVVLSARAGTISWRPALDRLPQLLARRRPNADFVIVYPSEPKTDFIDGMAMNDDIVLREALQNGHIVLNIEEDHREAVIESMLRSYSGERNGLIGRVKSDLTSISADYRSELQKGVVFYHSLSEYVSEPVLLVGISPGGITFHPTSSPIHVVLLVLNPADRNAPRHLRLLASVARMMRDPGVIDKLRSADAAEEVQDVLLAAAMQMRP